MPGTNLPKRCSVSGTIYRRPIWATIDCRQFVAAQSVSFHWSSQESQDHAVSHSGCHQPLHVVHLDLECSQPREFSSEKLHFTRMLHNVKFSAALLLVRHKFLRVDKPLIRVLRNTTRAQSSRCMAPTHRRNCGNNRSNLSAKKELYSTVID